jgi:CBS domain-containing protein
MLTVKDLMTRSVQTIDDGATVAQAAARMREEDVGWLPVLSDGRAVGVISDRDIVVRAVAGCRDPATTEVQEMASEEAVTCAPSDSVGQAAELMKNRCVRRLLVVDGDDRPVGVLSIGDLAVHVPDSGLAGEVLREVCEA